MTGWAGRAGGAGKAHRAGGRGAERGETLIEFALSSMVFFMTLFGILQMGLAIWNHNMLASLAQEGARWAAVRGSECYCTEADEDSVETYVRSRAVGMDSSGVYVTLTWSGSNSPSNAPGNTVQVRVDYTASVFSTIVRAAGLPLHGTAQMIVAR